jgi:hypothetical protein
MRPAVIITDFATPCQAIRLGASDIGNACAQRWRKGAGNPSCKRAAEGRQPLSASFSSAWLAFASASAKLRLTLATVLRKKGKQLAHSLAAKRVND